MKKFIAIMMVLGLVGFAVAQDLDCPTSGVAAPAAQDNGGEHGAVYDMIMSKLHEMEQKYIARTVSEWEWIKWGYWIGAGTNWNRGGGSDYGWANSSDIHYEYWMQGWMHVKLAGVLLLTVMHHIYALWRKDFAADRNTRSSRFYRMMNEVPTLAMVVIVVMVVVKPF